jgi:hypothetical protein
MQRFLSVPTVLPNSVVITVSATSFRFIGMGIHGEDFMKPLKSVVSSGKLRASWGLTGNNRVGEYDTYALYQILKDKVGDFFSIGSLPSVYIRSKTA